MTEGYRRTCRHCGVDFITGDHRRQNCSDECTSERIRLGKLRRRIKEHKPCASCGETMPVFYKNPNKRWCSRRCQYEARTGSPLGMPRVDVEDRIDLIQGGYALGMSAEAIAEDVGISLPSLVRWTHRVERPDLRRLLRRRGASLS